MRRVLPLLGLLGVLASCGSPPAPGPLVDRTSQRMIALHGFHFKMLVAGYTGPSMPIHSAEGDAHPPDLRATVDLLESGVLLEIEVVLSGNAVYLKSFTGGWQRLSQQEVAQFFDVSALFDRQQGLFAAMRDTSNPGRINQESVASHSTWAIGGTLAGQRVHRLLPIARDQGTYATTYWIDDGSNLLWREKLHGDLFDPTRPATITFEFSHHDEPVTVTPPPVG